MHQGRFVFAQLMDHLPLDAFRAAIGRYQGHRYVKRFSCLDQFLCMAFAQLTGRESLRDIELCLRAHEAKLYHLGIRGRIARSTLADANEKRDWRIFSDFAQHLIRQAIPLYADTPLAGDLQHAAYALDSTTIEVCLSAFPWARAPHAGHGGIKLHTLLDVRSSIPTVIHLLYTGSSSMHIGVDVHARDPRCEAGTRRRTTHCIVVFVAMDPDGRPIAVPPYLPETDEERELQAYAMRVMAMRQAIDAERKAFLSRAIPV